MLSVCSGYDFAYLLKVLTAQNLPSEESDFFDLLKLYFPNIYDVKYLMKSCKSLKGGLQEVAELLEVCRFEKIIFYSKESIWVILHMLLQMWEASTPEQALCVQALAGDIVLLGKTHHSRRDRNVPRLFTCV